MPRKKGAWYRVKVELAGVVFEIASKSQRPIIWLTTCYKVFLSTRKPHLVVRLHPGRKKKEEGAAPFTPHAQWQGHRLFCRTGSFEAEIDFTQRTASVFLESDARMAVLMRFLCSVMLARSGGFLLHSCAVLHKGSAYVFFGPSESGKTTIARLSKDKVILTDETTAIVKTRGAWRAYATPFAGEFGLPRHNAGGPIKALFAIAKDSRFSRRILKPGSAARQLSCSAFLHTADVRLIDATLQSLDTITREVPCYGLGFKAQPAIWRYLHGFIA